MPIRTVDNPRVVSRVEWLTARKKLLAKEKELTRQRDAIAAAEDFATDYAQAFSEPTAQTTSAA